VEIVEIPGHPFFLGCQFHPEFKSKPLEPHPLFHDFVIASYKNRNEQKGLASGTESVHGAIASKLQNASNAESVHDTGSSGNPMTR
jgi:hypothetical protein